MHSRVTAPATIGAIEFPLYSLSFERLTLRGPFSDAQRAAVLSTMGRPELTITLGRRQLTGTLVGYLLGAGAVSGQAEEWAEVYLSE